METGKFQSSGKVAKSGNPRTRGRSQTVEILKLEKRHEAGEILDRGRTDRVRKNHRRVKTRNPINRKYEKLMNL